MWAVERAPAHAHLAPLWPGFKSLSLLLLVIILAPRVLSGFSSFPVSSKNQHFQISVRSMETRDEESIPIYFILYSKTQWFTQDRYESKPARVHVWILMQNLSHEIRNKDMYGSRSEQVSDWVLSTGAAHVIITRVVSAFDSQPGGPELESRCDHWLDFFLGSPEINSLATLVNSQIVSLPPVGVFNLLYV